MPTSWSFIFLALGIVLAGAGMRVAALRIRAAIQAPNDFAMATTASRLRSDRRAVVVVLGDSITRGTLGCGFVERLQTAVDHRYLVLNGGTNGDLVLTAGRRLDSVLAVNPDVVVILLGTNDVNAEAEPRALARHVKAGRIPAGYRPGLASFAHHYQELIERIRNHTRAELVLCSIPLNGESREGTGNKIASRYSEAIRSLAARFGARYVPVNEAHLRLLETYGGGREYGYGLARSILFYSANFQRHVLSLSWDGVARRHGLRLTTDLVHMTSRTANEIADLLAESLLARRNGAA